MSIEIIVGANWGDEGKGRMVDYFAQDADFVIRYQGGNNAGHTVINEYGEFKLHLIPSGVFSKKTINILGPGMVINLQSLVEEIQSFQEKGIDPQIMISERATICFPYHQLEDVWEEERLGKNAYGSTRRGIAPVYGDRTVKKAILMGELLYPEKLKSRLEQIVKWKLQIARGVYGKESPFTFNEIWEWTQKWGGLLLPYIKDTNKILEDAVRAGKKILFEAQLGTLRDLYFGIYPYTTSSCTLSAFAPIGGGLFGFKPDRVIAVVKAFSTCVGEGPFVTLMEPEEADQLRKIAKEYGAATGRPRTIGHFDAVATRYGVKLQGATEVALTKLDSLTGRKVLKLCTHYQFEDKIFEDFPINPILEQSKPIYIELPGWDEDISKVRRFEDLPKNAQNYVIEIEKRIECPIKYISVGPEREALITR
ncbi:MAG TPA: adenylosuccinate synthase [Candidatus Hydrogenedens sp.]|nr:adenylosuccinate synthase [Candidatus Hydrogenedens sp.]HOL19437.1 adenylosuccinate synthase [Candidatus Hydrogenedens sp.]HPP58266.1 adenylosuccinate synthase [Candidatus Hydrogenedens sp.]